MIEQSKGEPVGYTARPVARRATRPLHRRKAILDEAEAVFKPATPSDIKTEAKCPTKN